MSLEVIVATASGGVNFMTFTNNGFLVSSGAAARMMVAFDPDNGTPLFTRSLRIRVRQITAVDLVAAQIEVNANYFTLERTS